MPAVFAEDGQRRDGVSLLDDIVREGARWMLAATYPAEHWVHLRTSNPIESTFPPCGTAPG